LAGLEVRTLYSARKPKRDREVVNKSERMLLDDKMEKRKNLPDLERYTGALGHLLLCANSWSV